MVPVRLIYRVSTVIDSFHYAEVSPGCHSGRVGTIPSHFENPVPIPSRPVPSRGINGMGRVRLRVRDSFRLILGLGLELSYPKPNLNPRAKPNFGLSYLYFQPLETALINLIPIISRLSNYFHTPMTLPL